jgi:hypothetical protein
LQLNYGARWPYSRIEKTPKSDFADPARELFPIDNQMDVDAAQWFANGVDIKQTNSILIPGAAAMKMADNYRNMLQIYVADQ